MSDTTLSMGLRRTPSKLDFASSGKPALVLSVMDSQVAQFINNERSYTFQLDTEDGGHYLLQATNKREMTKWLETISRVTKMAAKRRLTYLGNSPKPRLAIGVGVNWVSPFGPFRIDIAKALLKQEGDDTKLFSFNVGTQF